MTAPTTAGRVRFGVPESLVELDLAGDPDDRARRLVDRTPRLRPDQRVTILLAQEVLAETFRLRGIVYAGYGITAEVGPVRVPLVQLVVAVLPVRTGGPRALQALAAGLTTRPAGRRVSVLSLPAGAAVEVIERRGEGGHGQIHLPSPVRRALVTLSLSAETDAGWEECRPLLRDVARTVTFPAAAPEPTAPLPAIADALDGGRSC